MAQRTAIAIGAHPDDIEFYMAGTLLLLKKAGYAIHYFSVANGNCGSAKYNAAMTQSIRNTEARKGAKILGAEFHAPVANDLEVIYTVELLRAVSAVIRDVKPSIVLTHSPQDYMEDHMNAARLAVTAAFARGMPNFRTSPARPAADGEVTVYHGMPHGLCDQLRRRIVPGAFVNTASVQKLKREALAVHESQQGWLDESQGINSLTLAMEAMSRELGRLSKHFKCAEGWRRHLHLGFGGPDDDPLKEALGKDYLVNEQYERDLKAGC